MSLNDALHMSVLPRGIYIFCHVLPVVGIFAGVITTLSVFLSVSFVDILLFSQLDGACWLGQAFWQLTLDGMTGVMSVGIRSNLIFYSVSLLIFWGGSSSFNLSPDWHRMNTATQLRFCRFCWLTLAVTYRLYHSCTFHRHDNSYCFLQVVSFLCHLILLFM